MLSFHANPEIKTFFIDRARQFDADGILNDKYFSESVGCLIHSDSHQVLADELGIPLQMVGVFECLFEGLPEEHTRSFPLRFIEAIPVGVDITPVLDHFFMTRLADPEHGGILRVHGTAREGTQALIDLYRRKIEGDNPSKEEWKAAYIAAVGDPVERMIWDAAFSARSKARENSAFIADPADKTALSSAFRAAYKAELGDNFLWQAELLLSILKNFPIAGAREIEASHE